MPAPPKKQVQIPAPGLNLDGQATDLDAGAAKKSEVVPAPSLSIEPPAKGPFE
jgi:hypothetical protein